MARSLRVKVALATAVVAASLAAPTIDQAFAATTPTLPDLTSALSGAGIGSANITSITSELGTLQGLAPGGILSGLLSSPLSGLDTGVGTLNGLLPTPITSVVSSVTGLLGILGLGSNAAAPALSLIHI